jgi:hypothetical protein
VNNQPQAVGDNPDLPRDPDKFDADVDEQREFRQRGVPSGLANEIYLDVYVRRASFEPQVRNLQRRLFDAYAAEVARVDQNDDGIISAAEGDIDTPSDNFPNNERLFLPPTMFNRFAVTREINDGLLAPRFAPSQRAWVLTGVRVPVSPTVDAVRVVLEPKPGLPTDPNNPRAFNDVFTDISPLFVINNESGWYEGWMIHDITVPSVAPPRPDGRAQFGAITERDAADAGARRVRLASMTTGGC